MKPKVTEPLRGEAARRAQLQEITKRRGDILLTILTKMVKRGDVERRPDERFVAVRE